METPLKRFWIIITAFVVLSQPSWGQGESHCAIKGAPFSLKQVQSASESLIGYRNRSGGWEYAPTPDQDPTLVKMYNRFGFAFRRDTGWFVDFSGKPILKSLMYETGGDQDFLVEGLFRYIEHHQIGFANECMEKVIPAQFDFASSFRNGWSLVCKDCTVKLAVPQYYEDLGGAWALIDKSGQVWPQGWGQFQAAKGAFDHHTEMIRGKCNPLDSVGAWPAKNDGTPHKPEFDAGLTGFKNADGTWIMPPQLDNHFGLWEKTGLVYVAPYLIDLRGERRLLPSMHDVYKDDLDQGLMRFWYADKMGYADHCLDIVIEAQFDHASRFENGTATVCKGCIRELVDEYWRVEGGLWGIIDKTGQYVVPLIEDKDEVLRRKNALTDQTER